MHEELEPRFRDTASRVMVQVSRELRQRPTGAEVLLWEYLRGGRLDGIKFRRQHALANTNYVVDFYCYESRLVIELDGPIHDRQIEGDLARQRDIELLGDRVLRFRNSEVFDHLETVLTTIISAHFVGSQRVIGR